MPGSDFSLSHLNFFNSLSLRMMRFLKNIEFLIEVKEMRNSALFSRFLKETSNECLQHSLLKTIEH